MVDAGCEFMITEASSHALEQKRLSGVFFKAAAFTNLTGDHLDYHKTAERYLQAKVKLFEDLTENAAAVINQNSPEGRKIAQITEAPVIWYSLEGDGDICANIKSMSPQQTVFDMSLAGNNYQITTNLIGKYNVENLLAAAGLCYAANITPEKIARALNKPLNVPGRLEKVPSGKGFTVIVDYAHTDDALKNVLTNLNEIRKGRIITVFGCGGDRDTSKRPRMGRVAEQLSDIIIITSDNPRSEQPEYIIGEIATGLENPAGDNVLIEPDRKEAIKTAVEIARKNDIVLIAGKGHEEYQTIGDRKIPFSDRETAKKAIQQL
jgi:UDP-N-acetylmuramoyl-L-alanyl-D-glutamate--2,6-diaminopimelate ligase